jgi:hypothetical protein
MRTLGGALLAWLILSAPGLAEDPAACLVAISQAESEFPLPQVARAIDAKKLNVLVVGAGSSVLPGPNGIKNAYPARLQQALTEKLPGVAVTVTTDVKSKRTAAEMVTAMAPMLAETKPALVVWQTGTVDAMVATDPDQFSAALDRGFKKAQSAGADVVLINAQYSPRTESMIALATYVEDMRWVAMQHQMPLFDRFNIMKVWSDTGTFDLTPTTKKLDMAEHVHDCIGRLLAGLVIGSATRDRPKGQSSQ